jgi:hypothetical protein
MKPSPLSVVDSSIPSARVPESGSTCTSSTKNSETATNGSPGTLDFIGNSNAVKDLFSLPYAVDRPISVAFYNMGGTLLVDTDPDQDGAVANHFNQHTTKNEGLMPGKHSAKSSTVPSLPENERFENEQEESLSQSLVALSNLETSSEALTIVNSLIELSRCPPPKGNNGATAKSKDDLKESPVSLNNVSVPDSFLGIPQPADYVGRFIPPIAEPREYLSWKFNDMNLLIGSNATVYRSPDDSTALVVRLEEAGDLRALSRQHEDMVISGEFVADHQCAKVQQMGKPSYAEAARRKQHQIEQAKDRALKEEAGPRIAARSETRISSFAAPDLQQARLQTCTLPVLSTPVGGLLTARSGMGVVRLESISEPVTRSSSPVSTVLDTYLDNIMANVPQLALCLQERGFVQSIKLLSTEQIPSLFLRPGTSDTSIPFEVVNGGKPAERVFSPEIMEMNASTLLRFLKTQCCKDNATYLLRREAGHTNIQLYDISSISSQQQQRWNWWLAKMSYRFASRLRSLAASTPDRALRRQFRGRQRNLLQNTLELLDALSDMNGSAHESLIAAINEDLADTFLTSDDDEKARSDGNSGAKNPSALPFVVSQQPYPSATVDALSKAHDFFAAGIRILWPTLERCVRRSKKDSARRAKTSLSAQVVVVSVHCEEDASSGESDDDEDVESHPDFSPLTSQLFGLHNKLISVSLRLAEIHLGNYYSSSAMQALRTSARSLADSLYLAQLMNEDDKERTAIWIRQIQLQYTWLWEHCGHFSRSFAADAHWRDRGHASGEDVISVLQDVDCAFRDRLDLCTLTRSSSHITNPQDSLSRKSDGYITIRQLDGVVGFHVQGIKKGGEQLAFSPSTQMAAKEVLDKQGLLKREQRRVLVAACIAYGRSIDSYRRTVSSSEEESQNQTPLLALLQQRLGDACNETGKVMMNAVRTLLSSLPTEALEGQGLAAEPLLCSAEFWFLEGLVVFEACNDLCNLALLRCNLCQCCKLRANSVFARDDAKNTDGATHAEICIQEAANHLLAAHEALGLRDTDPLTWDMVSGELAATLLVLGVRRRQSLLGSGNIPLVIHTLRLSPGKERSIVDPMERALVIYEQSGNRHQAAATHYQLALFFSKIWTCQRDEAKTREKLTAAFQHYTAAHAFFSQNVPGNEPTFCVLCLDLSNLYSSVSGEEFLTKALLRCLDTSAAFNPQTIGEIVSDLSNRSEWLAKMDTLATSVEERVFKILRNLVKMEETSGEKDYKELYRVGLHLKMAPVSLPFLVGDESLDPKTNRLLALHRILTALRQQYDK